MSGKSKSRDGESAGSRLRQAARSGARRSDNSDNVAKACARCETTSAGDETQRSATHLARAESARSIIENAGSMCKAYSK